MIAALKTILLLCSLLAWYGFIFLLVLLIPKNNPSIPPVPLTVKLIQPVVAPTVATVKEAIDLVDKTPVLPTSLPVPTKVPEKMTAAVHKKIPAQKKAKSPKKEVAAKKIPSPKKQMAQPVVKNEKNEAVPPSTTPTSLSTNPVTPFAQPIPAQPKQQPITPAIVTQKPPINAAYLHNPKPRYPKLSRRLGEQGKVMLRVKVNQSGNVEQIQINTSSGFARLDTAAQNTVQNWSFIPAQRNGQAISDWVMVPIVFNLTD